MTVGIDIGTTSVKAVATDAAGSIIARARIPHLLRTSPPGTFEHEPGRAWRTDVVEALAAVAGGLDVAGICVAAMVPSLTAVDSSGSALAPGLLYGDRRGRHARGDPQLPGDGGELLAFLAWLADQFPDAAGYWPAQAVANHALCGEGVIDTYTAMTAYPLFDLNAWDASLATAVGATLEQLARIVTQTDPAGTVTDGLPAAGAVLAPGTVDGYAEQIMSGANEPGDVLVICGTTLITWAVTEHWATAEGTWTVPHHFSRHCLIGGPSNAGGLFQDHVARLVGPIDSREGAATALEPGQVPVWLPYVRGERTPLHRDDLRAGLHDIGLDHGPASILRAAQEAAAFVVRHHIELAETVGFEPRRIVAAGGGTRSAGLMQALADGTGLPVDVSASPEGAARGAAYLARCAVGLADGVTGADAWARTGHRVQPRPDWVEACRARYTRFRALTSAALAEAPGRPDPDRVIRT